MTVGHIVTVERNVTASVQYAGEDLARLISMGTELGQEGGMGTRGQAVNRVPETRPVMVPTIAYLREVGTTTRRREGELVDVRSGPRPPVTYRR